VGNNILGMCSDLELNPDGFFKIRTDNHIIAKIISTLSNLSEEDAEKMVENILFYKEKRFKEYPFEQFPYKRAFESLQSLITSLGLSGEILILQKCN
jgi:hypothetical protein